MKKLMEKNKITVLMLGWENIPQHNSGLGLVNNYLKKKLAKRVSLIWITPEQVSTEVPKNTPEKENIKTTPYQPSNVAVHRLSSEHVPRAYEKIYKHHRAEKLPDANQKIQKFTRKILYLAKEKKFDIIYAHDWLTFPAAVQLKELSQKPLLIHVHATEYDRRQRLSLDKNIIAIEQKAVRKADNILTVSERLKKTIVDYYGADTDKIRTLYPGGKIKQAKPKYEDNPRTQLLEPAFFESSDKKILFLGRITLQKGVMQFVATAEKLLKNRKDIKFWIVGEGVQLRSMITEVKRRSIIPHFHFLGFQNPYYVQKILRAVDILFLPAISEPFGMAVFEAIQADTPVVISKQTGIGEILDTTYQADYYAVETFAYIINKLLNNPKIRRQIIAKNKKRIQLLQWEIFAKQVKKSLEDTVILKNKPTK